MTTVQSSTMDIPNPSHTFMEKKPPLVPRQSTSDVLSFTHIIADRLAPGQSVWDYFSPAPPTASATLSDVARSGAASPALPLSPISPTFPTSPTTFSFFGNKRQSVIVDTSNNSSNNSKLPPLPPSQEPQCASPTTAEFQDNIATTTTSVTPRVQKRRSTFVQSLRNMLSLSQLILPSSAKIAAGAQPAGPPHYNILVLGSDSAPLASTLYKMSSLLPSTNKISHYQEISGFFVAYFRSNGSFSCSPKTSTELSEKERRRRSGASFRAEGDEEVKARGKGLEEIDQEGGGSRRHSTIRRSSAESEATLLNAARGGHSRDGTTDSDEDDKATLYQESLSTTATAAVHEDVPLSASANATLSVHAFSLDTTWPVPRILAQTFWFPHAHGIIYIVDATRKNDPRGMDHLLNARQFLASLVKDEHFRRKDIPVVVFANKAGMDEETCFRVDEIAEILGCEEWDDEGRVTVQGGKDMETAGATGDAQKVRAWCVKSTRSDGEGEGLRESVEWLKSRMGEIWKS